MAKDPVFVVQKHKSKTLHYDFRLEVGGILKSWAIPKGPSRDPAEKRLAIPTENHPLDYARFEGVIPEDEYGAGVVMVWDTGTYRNLKEVGQGRMSMDDAIQKGHVSVWLDGTKLKGGYSLLRSGKSGQWLLIKKNDSEADPATDPLVTSPRSAISGRTLEELAAEHSG